MHRKSPVDLSTAKVISDTFFVSASKIGVTLLKPVRSVILGRLLGPSLYGILSIPVSYVNLLAILSNIGFNTAVVKLIPDYRQRGRAELAGMIYRSTAALTVTLSIVWSILLLIFSRWIVENVAHQDDAINPMRIYALIIPFLAMNAFYAAAFLAMQRGKLRAAITLAHGFLNVLLPICAVLWKRNVTLVIGGFLAAEVIGAALFSIYFHKRVINVLSRAVGSLVRGMREVLGFGFLFFFANLGWNMINSVDKIMVKFYLPAEQLGFYSMATLVITALGVVASTTGTALIPSLTAAKVSGNTPVFNRQIHNTARFGFIALVPVVAVIYVLAGDLFSIVLPRFIRSVPIIRTLVFIGLVDILCRIAWAALVAHGRGGAAAFAYIFAAAWNILWNRILIPNHGIAGAALATLSTFIVLALLLQIMMWRISGNRIGLMSLLHPLVISFVFPLIGWLLRDLGPAARIIIILFPGTILYVFLSLLTGLVRSDDLSKAGTALEPRADIPHIRLALRLINLLEILKGRIGKGN